MAKVRFYWENPPMDLKAGGEVERIFHGRRYRRSVPPSGLLTSQEAAAALNCTLRHIYRLVELGKLKPVKRQGRWIFFRLREIKKYNFDRPARFRSEPWLTE